MGRHPLKGFGTAANATLAREWFRTRLDALSAGQPPFFAVGRPGRITLTLAMALGEIAPAVPPPASGSSVGGAQATVPGTRN